MGVRRWNMDIKGGVLGAGLCMLMGVKIGRPIGPTNI